LGFDADEIRKLLQEAGIADEAGVDEAAAANLSAWSEAGEQPGDESGATNSPEPAVKKTATSANDDIPPNNTAIYFRDISAVTLLSAEEEIELAQLIEAGEVSELRRAAYAQLGAALK
jgi:hypothetical protein